MSDPVAEWLARNQPTKCPTGARVTNERDMYNAVRGNVVTVERTDEDYDRENEAERMREDFATARASGMSQNDAFVEAQDWRERRFRRLNREDYD